MKFRFLILVLGWLSGLSPLYGQGGAREVRVPAGEVVAQGLDVVAPAGLRGRHEIEFVIASGDGNANARVDSTFLGPL